MLWKIIKNVFVKSDVGDCNPPTIAGQPPDAGNRGDEHFTAIKNLLHDGQQIPQVKNSITDVLVGNKPAFTQAELISFSARTIAELPRTGEYTTEINLSYETLIKLQMERGDNAQALHLFRLYLGDEPPACDAVYDRIYPAGLVATGSWPIPLRRRERFFHLVQLFRQSLPLDGLIAECGCFRGLSSYLLCSSLKLADAGFTGHGYRIFDSFSGLSTPQPEDNVPDGTPNATALRQMTQAGYFAASIDVVRQSLREFPDIEYFPGWIPTAFPDEQQARYRFVHVDVDVYQPTRDCLEYFYPRLMPGGILVSDDYSWPGARKAIEEFCAARSLEFRTTPHKQAYIVRQ